jgi:hypothetical protein
LAARLWRGHAPAKYNMSFHHTCELPSVCYLTGLSGHDTARQSLEALAMAAVGAVGVGVLASAHTSEGVAVSTAQEARYGPSTGRMDTNSSTADGNGAAEVARCEARGAGWVCHGSSV